MSVESNISPSEELLGEAARRVGEAYPGLYAHQRAGISFLLARRRAILADDMGLGKTLQTLALIKHAKASAPFLVVGPTSVVPNWVKEATAFTPDLDVRVVLLGGLGDDPRRAGVQALGGSHDDGGVGHGVSS